jgi:hypothetical protein
MAPVMEVLIATALTITVVFPNPVAVLALMGILESLGIQAA